MIKPTDRQIAALRSFRIPFEDIIRMDKSQATEKLKELISKLPPKKVSTFPEKAFSLPKEEPSRPTPADRPRTANEAGANAHSTTNEVVLSGLTKKWLDESISEIEQALGAKPTTDSVVLAELLRAKYGLYSISSIQKGKLASIRAIQERG